MDIYDQLYQALERLTLPQTTTTNNRLDFPKHRRATFGIVRGRFNGIIGLSVISKTHPDILQKLNVLGGMICSHDWNAIHVIHNLTTPPHKDKANVGTQTLVSFGEYTGGLLCVEGQEPYDANRNPISFNGFEYTHWNTPDLVGNKYSLIFFKIQSPPQYKIAIASHNRAHTLQTHTLSTLSRMGILPEYIDIFVSEDEIENYRIIDKNLYGRLIKGKVGLTNQRNYICEFYQDGQHILCLDDDLQEIDHHGYDSLNEFIQKAFQECIENGVYLWSVNPVWNPFWRLAKLEKKKTNLNFCIGAFHGIINRKCPELRIQITNGGKEDFERSIRFYLKDGRNIVYNRIGFKTKYFATGGLGLKEQRRERNEIETNILCAEWPELCQKKIRKNGWAEIRLLQKPRNGKN